MIKVRGKRDLEVLLLVTKMTEVGQGLQAEENDLEDGAV